MVSFKLFDTRIFCLLFLRRLNKAIFNLCLFNQLVDFILVVENYLVIIDFWVFFLDLIDGYLTDLLVPVGLSEFVERWEIVLYMDAVELEFDVWSIIFLSQLQIKLILFEKGPGVYLFNGLDFGKLPVDNTDLVLISKNQVESLVYFLCFLTHPLLRAHYQVIVLNYLSSDNKSNCVLYFLKLIWKFNLGIVSNNSSFEGLHILNFGVTFRKKLDQCMKAGSLLHNVNVFVTFFLRRQIWNFVEWTAIRSASWL